MFMLKKLVPAIVEHLSRGGNLVSAWLIALLMFMVSTDIIVRYASRPLPMVFELSEEFLVAIGFLGLAYTMATEGHISIDLLVSRLSAKARTVTTIINSGIALALFVVLGWVTSVMVWGMYQAKAMTDIVYGMPTWAVYIAIPIGSFLLCFQLILRLVRACRSLAGKSNTIDQSASEPKRSEVVSP